MTHPARDLFAAASAPSILPDDIAAGLDLLARSPPLWPVDSDRWSEVVGALMAFERRFAFSGGCQIPMRCWRGRCVGPADAAVRRRRGSVLASGKRGYRKPLFRHINALSLSLEI
jgi:hypothetical protein